MPRRETCAHGPPSLLAELLLLPGLGLIKRAWRTLAVVQPPITFSLPAVKQLLGISMANVVTFLSARSSRSTLSLPTGLAILIKSKVSPKFTTKESLR